jgi:hypothetical protein
MSEELNVGDLWRVPIVFISPFTDHVIGFEDDGMAVDVTARFRIQEYKDWCLHDNAPKAKKLIVIGKARAEAEEVFKRYRDWLNHQEIEGIKEVCEER